MRGDANRAATAVIVAAFARSNRLGASEVPGLMERVHQSLAGLNQARIAEMRANLARLRRAHVRRSITPDRLISFLDGRPYKTLGRHLRANGLTPTAYRALYDLPEDYPMIAANYARQRSEVAKASGLGVLTGRGKRAGAGA